MKENQIVSKLVSMILNAMYKNRNPMKYSTFNQIGIPNGGYENSIEQKIIYLPFYQNA